MTQLNWLATDSSLTYAVLNGTIHKYSAASNSYTTVYTNVNLTLSANATVSSYSNRVVVSDSGADTVTVKAYVFTSAANLTQILAHTSGNYSDSPIATLSPNLSKILIHGLASGNLTTFFYYVDYTNLEYSVLNFPAESVFDASSIFLALEENWLYVRQLPSVNQKVTGGNRQFVYALLLNTITSEAGRKNITASEEANCNKTIIRVLQNGTLFVLTQCNSTAPVVNLWEVIASKTQGSGIQSSMGTVVIEGQVKLCAPGCSDCSTGLCTACNSMYVFDSDAATCYQCGLDCTVCSAGNPNSCSACVNGAYLSGTQCLACKPTCTTCSGTSTSCQSCLPGQYFSNVACASCPRNCINCSSNATCTNCRKGFVVTSNGSCRGCSQSCSSCEASNIMVCTSCSSYLYLSAGICLPCPSRCQKCSGNVCAQCDRGYHPSSSNT